MTAASTPVEVHTERSMKQVLHRALLPEGRPASGILATGIESPDGRRKADAIWAAYQRGAGLEGYEIKVSRSDLLSELADPMKTEPWLQYCTRWWLFVSDPKLVDGLDIPEQWGIIAPPSGRRTRSLTTVRPAPKLHPIDTSPAWQRVVTWFAVRNADRSAAYEREINDLRKDRDRAQQRANDAQHGTSPRSRHMGRLYHRVLAGLHEHAVHQFQSSTTEEHDPIGDALVAAAVDHLLVERYTTSRLHEVQGLVNTLDRALAGLRDTWQPDALRTRVTELLEQRPAMLSSTAEDTQTRATA